MFGAEFSLDDEEPRRTVSALCAGEPFFEYGDRSAAESRETAILADGDARRRLAGRGHRRAEEVGSPHLEPPKFHL